MDYTGITAKLERADEHLETLTDEVGIFVKSEPNAYSLHIDGDAGSYCVRIALKRPPPIRLSIICGDYIHCLRSALDHLICGHVPEAQISKRTAFPTFDDPANFQAQVTVPAQRGKPGPLTDLIDPGGKLAAYVEHVQPYNGQHGVDHHPLHILANLSNADKHHAILATAMSHDASPDVKITGGPGVVFIGKAELFYNRTLVDGAEVLRGRFEPMPGTQPQVHVHGRLRTDVAFGDELVPSLSLDLLRNCVREVIENFQRLQGTHPVTSRP